MDKCPTCTHIQELNRTQNLAMRKIRKAMRLEEAVLVNEILAVGKEISQVSKEEMVMKGKPISLRLRDLRVKKEQLGAKWRGKEKQYFNTPEAIEALGWKNEIKSLSQHHPKCYGCGALGHLIQWGTIKFDGHNVCYLCELDIERQGEVVFRGRLAEQHKQEVKEAKYS